MPCIGWELALTLFIDLPALRKREVTSAIARHIAGVLDRDSVIQVLNSLSRSASSHVGPRLLLLLDTA